MAIRQDVDPNIGFGGEEVIDLGEIDLEESNKSSRLAPGGTILCVPVTPPPAELERPDPYTGRSFGGRYNIKELLARGGFGSVYVAEDTRLGRAPCAIKVVRIDNLPTEHRLDIARRVREREQLLAGKIRHPHLLPITDWSEGRGIFNGEEHHIIYMVSPLIENGQTLTDFVRSFTSPMPWPMIAELLRQICAAVNTIHDHQVIHRDLKPDNVMYVGMAHGYPHGLVLVLDFGSARRNNNFATVDGTTPLGTKPASITRIEGGVPLTPVYTAPEWPNSKRHTSAFDVFSLGGIFYFMVTGTPLMETPSQAEFESALVHGRIPHMRSLRPDVPEMLDETLWRRMLTVQPEERFADAGACWTGLEFILDTLAHPRPPTNVPRRGITPVMRPEDAGRGATPAASLRASTPKRRRQPTITPARVIAVLAAMGLLAALIAYREWLAHLFNL